MLNKSILLAPPSSSLIWRKLLVEEYYDTVTGSFYWYGFADRTGTGSISDRFLEGYGIAALYTNDYKDSSRRDYTQVYFDDYERFPANTLYLKRKDKDTLALQFGSGEGYRYTAYNTKYFTKDDVGKTLDICLSTTPFE